MNWKVTVILAGLLVVLLGIYLFSGGPGASGRSQKAKLIDIPPERVAKITVARKGEPEMTLEKAQDAVGPHWRLKPQDQPADQDAVQQMLWAMERFTGIGAMDPGRPEAAPDLTGLADPRVVVRIHATDKVHALRFGKPPPTHSDAVFFQIDGDPKLYLAEKSSCDAYDKSPAQLRARQLVRYAPYQVVRVELERKFTVKRQDEPARIEYEKSTCDRIEQGSERGWYLVHPYREKLEELRVQRLTSELSALAVEEIQPAGDPKAQGFEEPEVKVSLSLNGVPKPIVIHFGGPADGNRRRWVQVPDSGEVALIDARKFDDLPTQRKNLRTNVIFPFSKEAVKTFRMHARGLGTVRIERQENRRDNEPVIRVSWEMVEPQGLKIDYEKIEGFLGVILTQRVTDFLGVLDFKLAGLDPPEVTVTAETRDGKTHIFHFGLTTHGYMRREGLDEVFEVDADLVKAFKRLELNFLHEEIFNVPRDKLREFAFEARGAVPPTYYRMRLDEAKGKWKFVDPQHERQEVDEERLSGIMAVMNYIRAENRNFLGRDPGTAATYRLVDDRQAPAVLKIVYEGGPPGLAEIYISDNQNEEEPTQPKYYARLKESSVVFQINTKFVENLKRLGVLKK